MTTQLQDPPLAESAQYRRIAETKFWWGGLLQTHLTSSNYESVLSYHTYIRPMTDVLTRQYYSTESEARAGHKKIIKKYRTGLKPFKSICREITEELSCDKSLLLNIFMPILILLLLVDEAKS